MLAVEAIRKSRIFTLSEWWQKHRGEPIHTNGKWKCPYVMNEIYYPVKTKPLMEARLQGIFGFVAN